MKHLAILQRAGLLVVRRRGRQRWNHLNAVPIREIYERWVSRYEGQWSASLLGLRRVSESENGGQSMPPTAVAELSSFQIEQEMFVKAAPERVFRALTEDIDKWWAYRMSPERAPVVLEPVIGGRFYEGKTPENAVLWGTVTQIQRPALLRLTGTLGMIGRPVVSVYSYALEARDGGTLLKLSHHAFGDLDASWRENYSAGWDALLTQCFKPFVEQGIVAGPMTPPCAAGEE